ncbi:MAG: ATP-binding protein [Paludibacteraceae bacterium]
MTNGKFLGQWILLISMLIVVASVLFTNRLARQMADEEQKNMELWAEATRQLIMADANTDIDLISTIIENNTTIPVYMTDSAGRVLLSRNVKHPVEDPRTLNGPIVLDISDDNRQYIYYDESNTLRLLRYVPYVQFALIFVFIAIAVGLLLTVQRSEQDRVWVGLCKETAHQLGTPISSLNAWQELLTERYPNDELLPQMEKDIERLHVIADRFSKVGSATELQPTDIAVVVEDAVVYMRTRVPKRVVIEMELISSDGSVHTNPHNGSVGIIPLNAPLFGWVIENLIKNSVDAMGGEGHIEITLREEANDVMLDIADTGKGMDKRMQRCIFQTGFTTKQRGWGLGLTLSKRIVEEYHRGKLFLKSSKPGVGTTFRIVLKKSEEC